MIKSLKLFNWREMDYENHSVITGKNKGESCSSMFGACFGQCIDWLVCSSEQQCGKCVDPAG